MTVRADARRAEDGQVELRMSVTREGHHPGWRPAHATGVEGTVITYGGDVIQVGMTTAPVLRFSEDEAQAIYDALHKVVASRLSAPLEPSREDRLLAIIERLSTTK